MNLSAFEDKSHLPEPPEVCLALGEAAALWDRLVSHIADRYPPVHERWHFAGDANGWSLRLMRGERMVLYLTPQRGHFLVGVVLGEKAVMAVKAMNVAEVLALVEQAPEDAEGRGVRLQVSTGRDLRAAEHLAAAKMAR